jgi:hypothetical protein
MTVENKFTFEPHLDEETLEEYCFGRLPEGTVAAVEEHLLVCGTCLETHRELADYIRFMKAGTKDSYERSARLLAWPAGLVWGSAVALVCLAALGLRVVVSAENPAPPAATVQLVALRGAASMTSAPAGRPLDLALNVTDVQFSRSYHLEMVCARGQHVWDGWASASDGRLYAHAPKPLEPGVYWVRLYSAPGELLREFGLRLK